MEITLLVVRLLLAAVFGIAGLAKLADRAGSRQAVIDFGVPVRFAGLLGTLLPLVEILVAVALIPTTTAWWGGVGALALLLLFVAGISVNLAQGRTPDCHCFGQLHSAPAGWPTLTRNGILAAVAGLLVWQGATNPGASLFRWLDSLSGMQIVGGIVVTLVLILLAGQGYFLLELMRQNGRLLLRIETLEANHTSSETPALPPAHTPSGLPVGSRAPEFQLTSVTGENVSLEILRARRMPSLLLFSDPGCGPCNTLLPDIARWQHQLSSQMSVVPISRGGIEPNRAKSVEHGLTQILLQKDREVANAYKAYGTPSAVLVHVDGTIGSSVAAGPDAIRSLVTRTVSAVDSHQPTAITVKNDCNCGKQTRNCPCGRQNDNNGAQAPVEHGTSLMGEVAPALLLPDLMGKSIDLADFRGSPTIVLFWNPSCGFCSRMLDDLKAWEATRTKTSPQLLVVSTGSVDTNVAMGLQSSVVLDSNFTVGRAFGVSGTPSAILVDKDGRIASPVAVGAPAVFALALAEQDQTEASLV